MRELNFIDFFDIFRIAKCNKVILLQSVTGILHATSKKVNLKHVFFFIEKLKGMALVLDENEVLSNVSSGDFYFFIFYLSIYLKLAK